MENIILYNTEDGKASVKLYAENNTVWLTQAQMALLFDCSTDNISLHLKNIYKEATTEKSSVVQKERVIFPNVWENEKDRPAPTPDGPCKHPPIR